MERLAASAAKGGALDHQSLPRLSKPLLPGAETEHVSVSTVGEEPKSPDLRCGKYETLCHPLPWLTEPNLFQNKGDQFCPT